MKRNLYLIALMSAAIPCSLRAQVPSPTPQDTTPPVDIASVMKLLDGIKTQQATGAKTNMMGYAQQFMRFAGDNGAAVGYYEDAIRATKFAGQSMQGTEYLEWKKAESARMTGKPFRDALSLHFYYLALTLKRSSGVEVKDLLTDLIAYTQQVAALQDSGGGAGNAVVNFNNNNRGRGRQQQPLYQQEQQQKQEAALDPEFMNSPLDSSVFVRWLQIGSFVEPEGWESTPGHVDGIFEKTILPEYRRSRDMRVFQYWDDRIQRESDQASKSGRTFDTDKFEQMERPTLLWSRALEYANLGMKNRAVSEMVTVIKSYPTHPSVPEWVAQVTALLKPPTVPLAAAGPAMPPIPPGVPPPAPAAQPSAPASSSPPPVVIPMPTAPPQPVAPVATAPAATPVAAPVVPSAPITRPAGGGAGPVVIPQG